jgi:putative cell wall-binding protein
MKKFLTLLLAMMLIMTSFTACGSGSEDTNGGASAVEGTPAEIIEKIYEQHPVADLPLGTIELDLADADAVKMFTGLDSADKIDSAAASESMMGAQAYSLVVVRVKDAADAAAVAEEMMNGIDQRKWICVEADDLRVAAAGDVVVLMMVSSAHADVVTAEGIIDAFGAVAGSLDLNEAKQ